MVTRIYRYEIHINLTFQCCVDIVIKLQIILEMYHMIIIKVVEFNKKKEGKSFNRLSAIDRILSK